MPPRRLQISRLLYWIAVVSLFALAAWQRFSLPLDPIADPDTWGYLSPALKNLTGSDLVRPEGRNFLYPGFLFLLLRLFGDFRAITITQHLLGLTASGLLLVTWRRARVFRKAPGLGPRSYNVIGLMAAAIFLFAGEPVRAEMQIRPEGVCAFFLGLNLWLAVKFMAVTFVEKRPLAVGVGVGTAVTAIVLLSLKPSLTFLALVSVLPVGLSFLREGLFSRKIWLAGGAALAALLLLLPGYFLNREEDVGQPFLPATLFVVHADLIRDQMADDLRLGAKLPYSSEWLTAVQADLSAEIAKSRAAEPEHYFSLGFSPDYLMYREDSITYRLGEELHYNNAAVGAFYRFYYWRTWRERPIEMLKKIGRQLAIFYGPICPAYSRSKIMPLAVGYQLGFTTLNHFDYPEVWKIYPPAVEFMRRIELLAQRAPSIEQSRVMRRTLDLLGGAYLPLLASTLALAAATLFWRVYRRREGWLVALTLFAFSYNAAACLEVAILNSLEVPRYSTVQMFFTLLAEFLAAWLLYETVMGWRERTDSSPA